MTQLFAHIDQLPTNGVTFRLYSGNRILVARNAETNNLELEVACNLARGLAFAGSKFAKDAPDEVQVKAAIEKLAAVIDQARAIEKGVAIARKGIDQIETSYTDLRKDALGIVNEIMSVDFHNIKGYISDLSLGFFADLYSIIDNKKVYTYRKKGSNEINNVIHLLSGGRLGITFNPVNGEPVENDDPPDVDGGL